MIQVIVTMIKTPLALFQVQVKSRRRDALELLQAPLGITPEALNAVNVTLVISKLVCAVIDPEVFGIADIDEAVIATPALRVNDRINRNATAIETRPRIMACSVAFLQSATISM